MGQTMFVQGAVLCTAACSAAVSLASTQQTAAGPPLVQSEVSPDTATCPRGSHCWSRTAAPRRTKLGRGAHADRRDCHFHVTEHSNIQKRTGEQTGVQVERKAGVLGARGGLPEKLASLCFSSPDVVGYFFGEIPFLF